MRKYKKCNSNLKSIQGAKCYFILTAHSSKISLVLIVVMSFIGVVDRQKCVLPYVVSGLLSRVLPVANVGQAAEAVSCRCSLK